MHSLRKSELCEESHEIWNITDSIKKILFIISLISIFPSNMNTQCIRRCSCASHPQESWTAAVLASALDPSATRLAPPGVSRQPAALHWLCRPGVHVPGQEARLRGPAHHHRRLLGALWDLGGEQLGRQLLYCTDREEECKCDVSKADNCTQKKVVCCLHQLTFEERWKKKMD